ncbi:bck1-like resistance to osmotic shock [Malassezia vespertilionis]|uniref:BRO domain-containing protein 1 n=1 Tax=Malassezia vespertilionis TaxID=2020962 RepID=A0A2N1JA11_9BASI|nr:bck1-like resistance to osmotic shock [Malassezia vespertilionis]PKI83383.1 Bro1p [Malassezia vespertilionis]WFD07137.1 bck1-like resistance to osmotic shock [Malassezia vespertilionis]
MQLPLLALPLKETREVELAKPIGALIRTVYEQDPNSFENDLRSVQEARLDATRTASSDATGRDLLFKWFHMLEMIELRFQELRVPLTWSDAFSGKQVTQQALAYEKASVIFNCAARIAAVSATFDRKDGGEGLKRCYTGMRQAAGLLDYIHSNFLHAPSDDMGGSMIKTLQTLLLVQASEVFLEKSMQDGKGIALIAKLASHIESVYATLAEEWQDTSTFASIPSLWRVLVAFKSKYFAAMTHYYRAQADDAGDEHGVALTRLRLAVRCVKDAAQRAAHVSPSYFSSKLSSTVPGDALAAVTGASKSLLAACEDTMRAMERDNDLVYHSLLPPESALAPVDKTTVTGAISIRDTFMHPDVQRILGPEVFLALVPLSVHESASVYSEEQAKLVRGEAEHIETANGTLAASLDALRLPGALTRYGALQGADAARTYAPSASLLEHAERMQSTHDKYAQSAAGIDKRLAEIQRPWRAAQRIDDALAALEEDARACEHQRAQHGHRWTQEPTMSAARTLRNDLLQSRAALEKARTSDANLASLWASVRHDTLLLQRGPEAVRDAVRDAVQNAARNASRVKEANLLDWEPGQDPSEEEARALYLEAQEKWNALQSLPAKRDAMLAELKTRVRSDDISHVLLLNRRVQNIEPQVFAAELAKFTPLQQQLRESAAAQKHDVHTLRTMLDALAAHPGTLSIREQDKACAEAHALVSARLVRAYESHTELCDVLGNAVQFYNDLETIAQQTCQEVMDLLTQRRIEREALVSQLSYAPATSLADDLHALRLSEPAAPPLKRAASPKPPRPPLV